eukprot:NODE_728_length_4389_cov_0.864569.p1 type:complete len:999 gc:universal NODE_728_length_4389_cov_0.864569:380-3376(+)
MSEVNFFELSQIELEDQLAAAEIPCEPLTIQRVHREEEFELDIFKSEVNEEYQLILTLRKLYQQGLPFRAFLYAYRCSALSVPQVKSHDQENKSEMYQATYEVLKPNVIEMKKFMKFCLSVVSTLKEITDKASKMTPSTDLLRELGVSLDMVLTLDCLKNMKASLNNDFSLYKRCLSNLGPTVGQEEMMENNQLYFFLGNKDSFMLALKEELFKIPSFEDVLIEVINNQVDFFEKGMFLSPSEKYVLLRSIAAASVIVHAERKEPSKELLLKLKRIKYDKVYKALKSNQYVPLFGEMTLQTSVLFRKTTIADQFKDEVIQNNLNLLSQLEQTQSDFQNIAMKLKIFVNVYDHTTAASVLNAETVRNMSNTMVDGLKLIVQWTCVILEHNASKIVNPADPEKNQCPPEAKEYERAIRYNYNETEKETLLHYIYMVKTLSQLLSEVELKYSDVIRKTVYITYQEFTRNTVDSLISFAQKKKKSYASILQSIQNLGSDILNRGQAYRTVGPSNTQVFLTRMLVHKCLTESNKGQGGLFSKNANFSDVQLEEISKFVDQSYAFEAMLDYKHHLRLASDLSPLWFKEFYLELSKEVQFPIECSLPWILMDFMLSQSSPEYTEFLLVPFSIYNDAAHESLYKLNLAYLFDEVEAEANLVFDQFIFKYSEIVFSHFKTRSSRMLIEQEIDYVDPNSKNKSPTGNTKKPFHQGDLRAFHTLHESILSQRRFYLLGRFIDIRRVMGQCMNQYFRKSLDVAINRFEASDLTFSVQLGFLIRCNRLAHRLASEIMPVDPFEDMLNEVDESSTLGAMGGRLFAHTYSEIINDIMPNYCFSSVTERFVKSMTSKNKARPSAKAPVIYLFGTKALNLYVNKQFAGYKGFIGVSPHFAAISKLIGKRQTASLINEIGNVCTQLIESHITPYMKILIKGFPSLKLPSVEYKTQGVYQFFISALASLLKYQDLPQVVNAFKEIGNGIACCKLLEESLVFFIKVDSRIGYQRNDKL